MEEALERSRQAAQQEQGQGRQARADDAPWDPTDKGGTMEKIIATVVAFPLRMAEKLTAEAGFKSLKELVFQEGLSQEKRALLPWDSEAEVKAVRDWFRFLCLVTTPFWVVAVAATAFRFLYAGTNPAARAEAWESVQRWFLAIAAVALAPFAVQLFISLTNILLDAIKGAFQAVAGPLNRGVGDWGIDLAGVKIATGSCLGTAIVKVALFFISCYFNALYIVRKLALTVFYVFTPIMALLWALNRNVTAAAIWLGELASNAFMPVAHALVLCTILLMCDVKNVGQGGSWVTIIIMLYTLVPLAEVLRNSLQSLFTRMSGLDERSTAMGGLLAAAGLASVVGMGRVARATFGGRPAPLEEGPLPGGGFGPTPTVPGGGTLAPSPAPSPGPGGGLGGALDLRASGGGALDASAGPRRIGFLSPDIPSGPSPGAGSPGPAPAGGPALPKSGGLEGSARAAAVWGERAARFTAGVLRPIAGIVPGGERLADAAGAVAGVAVRGGIVLGRTGMAVIGRLRAGESTREAFKAETGAETAVGGVGRTLWTAAKSTFSPEEGLRQGRIYMNLPPVKLGGRYKP
ncbi:MAG: hypothetical protein H5T97_03930 [Firmicutes bacterium]|nr:hypothetical protein [Bacillota bacterium]